MADKVIVAIRSFAKGMQTFVCPWNHTCKSSKRIPRNVTIYFDTVGSRINRAERRFAKNHPEVIVHAD